MIQALPQSVQRRESGVAALEDDASPYVWMKLDRDNTWKPLWKSDTASLEEALKSDSSSPVCVDGGRFRVSLPKREMEAVYWNETKRILRSSWWCKTMTGAFVPFEEAEAKVAEALYQSLRQDIIKAASSPLVQQVLKREVVVPGTTDSIIGVAKIVEAEQQPPKSSRGKAALAPSTAGRVERSPSSEQPGAPSAWWEIELTHQSVQMGIVKFGKTLRRGMGEYTVDGEEQEAGRTPDHVVFVVHGIGEKIWSSGAMGDSLPSLKSVVEMLRRNTLDQQIRVLEPVVPPAPTSARAPAATKPDPEAEARKAASVGKRAEFIPIEWYDDIRSDDGDLTRRIRRVTLPSVPLFRQFANDAVMDILLYMDPGYRQRILSCVGRKLNLMLKTFRELNPGFNGRVSVVGHSLGSVILFDLLSHQREQASDAIVTALDPAIEYPQLEFKPYMFVAMGSPIGMFLTVREAVLDEGFRLPTVSRFINVFHPYDPVAYRIEPILQPAMCKVEPALVPTHSGGASFVTRMREGQKSITGTMSSIASTASSLWAGIRRVSSVDVDNSLGLRTALLEGGGANGVSAITDKDTTTTSTATGSLDDGDKESASPRPDRIAINMGGRVDYALQEGIAEPLNEYLSAISSHSSYFGSKDVAALLVRLIHGLDIPA